MKPLFLIILLVLGIGVGSTLLTNALICAFIGNLHGYYPDVIPAIGWTETFSLFLPLYVLGFMGALWSSKS